MAAQENRGYRACIQRKTERIGRISPKWLSRPMAFLESFQVAEIPQG